MGNKGFHETLDEQMPGCCFFTCSEVKDECFMFLVTALVIYLHYSSCFFILSMVIFSLLDHPILMIGESLSAVLHPNLELTYASVPRGLETFISFSHEQARFST